MNLSFLVQLILSAVVSFILCKAFLGKYEGDKIERSFRLKIGAYRIHIHHWIWGSMILILLIIIHFYQPIILGLLSGAILQGLWYKDRFVIVYKDKDFEKIYSKYRQNK